MVSCSSWSTFNEASQKIIVVLQDLNVFVFFFLFKTDTTKKSGSLNVALFWSSPLMKDQRTVKHRIYRCVVANQM